MMYNSLGLTLEELKKIAPSKYTENAGQMFYWICKLIDAKTTIEIGVWKGYVSLLLGCHCKEVGGTHVGVDIEKEKCENLEDLAKRFSLPINVVWGDSKYMVVEQDFDFAFIDGEHTAQGLSNDILKLTNRCKVIAFHDYYSDKYGELGPTIDWWYEKYKDDFGMINFPLDMGIVLWVRRTWYGHLRTRLAPKPRVDGNAGEEQVQSVDEGCETG
jgi:hypothetical protein